MSRFIKLLTPLLAMLLVACDTSSSSSSSELPSSETPSSETLPSETISSEVSSQDNSSGVSSSSENSSETSSEDNSSSENNSSSSSSSSSSSEDEKERLPLSFDAGDYNYGKRYYDTGSFGVGSLYGYTFEHYRVKRGYDGMVLMPYYEDRTEYEIGGSLTNSVGLLGMNQISLTYSTSGSTGALPRLYTSDTLLFEHYIEFPLSTTKTTKTINFSPANYFRIETSDHELELNSFVVMYEGETVYPEFDYKGSGEDYWRLNPTVFHGDLLEGSKVTVPLDVVKTGSSYTVKSSRTYTYYSFNYVYNNHYSLGEVSDFAYTDPVDLAAFYTAFKTWPANYANKYYFDDVQDIFGEDARQVSSYQRTDGYATSVPWNSIPGQDVPQYYELDIALGSSYFSSRGLGRLVCWEYGFDSPGYDSSPVCVYTDDHYGTFSEYLNNGSFAARFNSERIRTNYVWSAPTTLS